MLILGIVVRIFSNSYLNVYQKLLSQKGERSSVINFYTYLGLSSLALLLSNNLVFKTTMLPDIIIMGVLGALGNFFIIKALSCGELSTLAPINSYKPVVALIFGIFLLNESPNIIQLFGMFLIVLGTFFLGNSYKFFYNKATVYRFLALIFSGTEAIFIKRILLESNINSAFIYWAIAGLIFSSVFLFITKHSFKIKRTNIKYQLILILLVALMQYSTNYVFSKINVAYALALFQLSTIISVFLGVNVFKENGLLKKILASFIMILGAVFIILN